MLPTTLIFLHYQVPQCQAIRGLKLCTLRVQSNTNRVSKFQGAGVATGSFFHDVCHLYTNIHKGKMTNSKTMNCLLAGCLTSQQHASVSQGRIYSDNFTCCHTEIEVADPTFYLTQSQYTDTRPTSPSTDPKTPGAWQGSHWSAIF